MAVVDNLHAYATLEARRWPDGAVCPHCGGDDTYYIEPLNGVSRVTGPIRDGRRSQSVRRLHKCARCRKQFSVLTGSSFHGSKIPAAVLVEIMDQFAADPTISGRALSDRCPINHGTACRVLRILRAVDGRWESPPTTTPMAWGDE